MSKTRNYAKATEYENSPEQIKHREARNRARAAALKAGTVHKGDRLEVDHKVPMADGGGGGGNLRVIPESRNTAWRKGVKGYKVKSV